MDSIQFLINATPSLCTIFLPDSGMRMPGSVYSILNIKIDSFGLPGTILNERPPDPLPAAMGGLSTPSFFLSFSCYSKNKPDVLAGPFSFLKKGL